MQYEEIDRIIKEAHDNKKQVVVFCKDFSARGTIESTESLMHGILFTSAKYFVSLELKRPKGSIMRIETSDILRVEYDIESLPIGKPTIKFKEEK